MLPVSKALLVMDMQKDLCWDPRRRDKVSDLIPRLRRVIHAFAQARQAVFYPCLSLPEDDLQFRRFGDRYCIAGTGGAEIIPELLPLDGPVILKRKHSAFFETDLERRLAELGVRE